jgi:TctA family transporter
MNSESFASLIIVSTNMLFISLVLYAGYMLFVSTGLVNYIATNVLTPGEEMEEIILLLSGLFTMGLIMMTANELTGKIEQSFMKLKQENEDLKREIAKLKQELYDIRSKEMNLDLDIDDKYKKE